MPNQHISNTFRSAFLIATTVMVSTSLSLAYSGKPQRRLDTVKQQEWIGNRLPSIGLASAPIKVVFFIDYQCPSCRTADPLIRKAIAKRSNAALIYREFPLAMHVLAKLAAIVAENARTQGTFDLAHHRLMEGQVVTEDVIKEAARAAGVSMVQSAQTAERIQSDQSLEKKLKLSSVPTFIVIENGKSTLMNKQQVLEFLK